MLLFINMGLKLIIQVIFNSSSSGVLVEVAWCCEHHCVGNGSSVTRKIYSFTGTSKYQLEQLEVINEDMS